MSTRGHARRLGLPVLARVVAHATHALAPAEFTLAPIGAVQKVLARAGWTVSDVDLFEINEAFAVVVMAAMKDLGLGHDRVNVHGGACALGHPIGASGARTLVTLLHAPLARHQNVRHAAPGSADLCLLTTTPLSEVVRHLQMHGVAVVQGPVSATGAKSPLCSIYLYDADENLIEVSNEVSPLQADLAAQSSL